MSDHSSGMPYVILGAVAAVLLLGVGIGIGLCVLL